MIGKVSVIRFIFSVLDGGSSSDPCLYIDEGTTNGSNSVVSELVSAGTRRADGEGPNKSLLEGGSHANEGSGFSREVISIRAGKQTPKCGVLAKNPTEYFEKNDNSETLSAEIFGTLSIKQQQDPGDEAPDSRADNFGENAIGLSADVNPGTRKRKAGTERSTPNKRHEGYFPVRDDSSDEPVKDFDDTESSNRNTSAASSDEMNTCRIFKLKKNTCGILPKENDRADFEAKYRQNVLLGKGGFGCVYAGYRIADNLPVAIKHITRVPEPKRGKIPLEVALMQKMAGGPETMGRSAAVTLFDWYYLEDELILVMEKPVGAIDLEDFLDIRRVSCVDEEEAKLFLSQTVDAAIEMEEKGVFHRDIKCGNLLVDMGCDEMRVRVIDFGCGTFDKGKSYYIFAGTPDYAPPEWYIDGKYEAGPTTVWQLGVLLYCLLHNSHFCTMGYMNGKIVPSSDLSQDCLDFFQKSLADNPKKRPTLLQLKDHRWLK